MRLKKLLALGGIVLACSGSEAAPPEAFFAVELVKTQNFAQSVPPKDFERSRYLTDIATARSRLKTDILNLLEVAKTQSKDAPARLDGDMKKGLKFALQLLEQMENAPVEKIKELAWQLYSVTEAINNNFRPNLRTEVRLYQIPKVLKSFQYFLVGNHPVTKTTGLDPSIQDSSRWSPTNSTIWKQPKDIASQNLYVGFDRKFLPEYSKTTFTYFKPKTGFGTHPGFRVTDDNGDEFKIRIGSETFVGPFASRIVWALGYNTIMIDHLPILKIQYDRRILSEYNLRKPVYLKIKAGPITILNVDNQKYHDPFNDVAYAQLSTGQRINGQELKRRLLKESDAGTETDENSYNEDFEKKIVSLEFHHVSIEKIDPTRHSVGPWDWDSDVHTQYRELRGYALLAGWLGQYDARTENTRLTLVETEKNVFQLEHTISDVGSGLGEASGLKHHFTHQPEKFESQFLERVRNKGGSSKIQSVGFTTLVPNKTFTSMNEDDAKWMARMMAQLTPRQIRDALVVSGFKREEVEIYLKKLLERRDNALKVLRL